MIVCDTNILISVYRNNQSVIEELGRIGQEQTAVSIITSCELLFGALNKNELKKINADLRKIKVLHVNEAIGKTARDLMNRFSLSHHLSLPDAFIAATTLYTGFELYTLNLKDFRFIPSIRLYKP